MLAARGELGILIGKADLWNTCYIGRDCYFLPLLERFGVIIGLGPPVGGEQDLSFGWGRR